MPKLIGLRDEAQLVLVGGAICTGKDTAAGKAVEILGQRNHSASLVSMAECVRIAGGLSEDDPIEMYHAVFKGKENDPWLARAISKAYEIEEGTIPVVSGLMRKCDAEYFNTTFPNSYFISLIADENTLVERIVGSNRQMDFPPGTPEEQKPEIARQLLRDEERVHGIMAMLGYVAKEIPRARTYLIDTSRQKGTAELELKVGIALRHFSLV